MGTGDVRRSSSLRPRLTGEISLDSMIAEAPNAPALQDDRPQNEYYAIRRGAGESGTSETGALETGAIEAHLCVQEK